jgi:hypothetical protein
MLKLQQQLPCQAAKALKLLLWLLHFTVISCCCSTTCYGCAVVAVAVCWVVLPHGLLHAAAGVLPAAAIACQRN